MIVSGLILGAVLGIVMQRGRFCVTGMLRDIFLLKSWRTFTALLIVISVHAVGLSALRTLGVIETPVDNFAPIAVVAGGFIFGIGIVLAGGCASGTWYRSGEGLIGSWFALLFYCIFAGAMKTGSLQWLNDGLRERTINATTLPETFGISTWYFALGLSALTAYLTWYFLKRETKVATLSNQQGWKKPLHVYTAGALVGILGVIAWPLSAATGRNSGLGITTPSANIANYTITGNAEKIDWGVMLVLGILIGSFIAAKATGEFRLRVPDATTAVRSIFGGALMGVGAALAGGCTVGNGMVETSLFSYQGWIALLFIALGVGFAAKIWLKPSTAGAKATAADETYSTEQSVDQSVTASGVDHESRVNRDFSFAIAPAGVALKTKVSKPGLRQISERKYYLDQMGAVCPFPLIEAKDAINQLESGDALEIDFDCTQGTETIPRWAADNGHEVTDFRALDDASWKITIVKG